MAEKKENQKPNLTVVGGAGGNTAKCQFVECKAHPKRANFCSPHFEWFKEGLITVKGEKAKDFDKKYQWYTNKHKKAA
jgi:hypothetical protein